VNKDNNKTKPQVVILCGGLGTRLGDVTKDIPKPMVMVNGKPFLEWQLLHLKKNGFTKFLFLTGYKGDKIKEYFDDGKKWEVTIEYSHEKEQLGTGGAILQAKMYLDAEFLLLFGDSFLPTDFTEMTSKLEQAADIVMALYDNKENTDVPFNVSVDNKAFIDGYYKEGTSQPKPERPLRFVEAGAYYVRKMFLASVPLKFCSFEADLLRAPIRMHKVRGWLAPIRFYDIGTPERLSLFESKLSDYFSDAV
jgi:NDP-sugar pyrophosphorylase family protein